MTLTPRPGIAERLSRMIQVQTVDPITTALDEFEQLLAELFPLVHKHCELERVPQGLLFQWRGKTSDDPAVLMAHSDVVPADERDGWSHPPFAGTIADGWVVGRGALDDKGPMLVVLEAVENLLAANFTPRRDVYLSFGGNEETTGEAGRLLSDLLHDRGVTPWIVIDEGGAVVDDPLPFVPGKHAMIGLAEKGLATIRLSAQTTGGHASTPERLTAVSRVARAVNRLIPAMFPARAPEAVTRMLESLSNTATPATAPLLRRAAKHPKLAARLLTLAGGETAAMVRTTIAATMIEGGSAHNVLPGHASATINLRIAIGETVREVVQRVRMQVRDPLVTVELVMGNDPSPESSADSDQFALITRALRASHPDASPVPYLVMAATDARHFHRYSPEVFRFAPLQMSVEQRASIHGVDERVEISELERGEVFFRTLIQNL